MSCLNRIVIARDGSHNIGNVASQKGQYKESRRWLNEALHLYQQTWPSNHPAPANTYHCIGSLYEGRRRKYSQALDAYGMAFDQFRRYFGNDHPRVALCYMSMASVYSQEKNFEQAIASAREALIIDEKCLPPVHPDLVMIPLRPRRCAHGKRRTRYGFSAL